MATSFSSALIQMRHGSKVRRQVWPADLSITVIEADKNDSTHFRQFKGNLSEVWLPCTKDILSNDWVLA